MGQRFYWYVNLVVMMIGLTTACDDIPDCDDPNTSEVIIQFQDTSMVSTTLFFNTISELNSGVVFVENDTLSQVSLEVNPEDTVVSYIFESLEETDTLTLSYRKNIFLISERCGPVQRFLELEILNQTFQDTVLVNRELRRDEVNIQVIP